MSKAAGVAALDLYLARGYAEGWGFSFTYADLSASPTGAQDWSALAGLPAVGPGLAAGSPAVDETTLDDAQYYRGSDPNSACTDGVRLPSRTPSNSTHWPARSTWTCKTWPRSPRTPGISRFELRSCIVACSIGRDLMTNKACLIFARGCSRSQIDLVRLHAYFEANSWEITSSPREADMVVVSACAFTGARAADKRGLPADSSPARCRPAPGW